MCAGSPPLKAKASSATPYSHAMPRGHPLQAHPRVAGYRRDFHRPIAFSGGCRRGFVGRVERFYDAAAFAVREDQRSDRALQPFCFSEVFFGFAGDARFAGHFKEAGGQDHFFGRRFQFAFFRVGRNAGFHFFGDLPDLFSQRTSAEAVDVKTAPTTVSSATTARTDTLASLMAHPPHAPALAFAAIPTSPGLISQVY